MTSISLSCVNKPTSAEKRWTCHLRRLQTSSLLMVSFSSTGLTPSQRALELHSLLYAICKLRHLVMNLAACLCTLSMSLTWYGSQIIAPYSSTNWTKKIYWKKKTDEQPTMDFLTGVFIIDRFRSYNDLSQDTLNQKICHWSIKKQINSVTWWLSKVSDLICSKNSYVFSEHH